MPAIVVRNLSEETHRALKVRAASNARSTEAEVRAILEVAVAPPGRVRLGSVLAGLAPDEYGVDLDIQRSGTAADPIDLG